MSSYETPEEKKVIEAIKLLVAANTVGTAFIMMIWLTGLTFMTAAWKTR